MARDDQIRSLQRRLQAEKDAHAEVVAAKNHEIRVLRDGWELFDTFPALQPFLGWLHKVRDAAGPLRSPTFQTGHSAETMSSAERGAFPDGDRSRLTQVNKDLEYWATQLERRLTPRGPLVDDEIPDVSKPTCFNPDCPARLVPQAFDREICYDCKTAFTEYRPGPVESKRCWTRDCPWYSKTGHCLHSWQR